MATSERLMTTDEVAEMLGVPVSTLYGWNWRRTGPPAIKVGKYVRYRRAAVEQWLDARTVGPGSAA